MKTEEYIGTLSCGRSGKIIFDKAAYSNINEIMKSKTPVYGGWGAHFIRLIYNENEFSEQEMIKAGYYRLIKIVKITTTVEQEEIWHC